MIDWTQIAITLITTAGGVLSVVFAKRARSHANDAATSADRAVEASMRPPPAPNDRATPKEGVRIVR